MKLITTPETQLEVDKVTVTSINKESATYKLKRGFNEWHSHKVYSYLKRNNNLKIAITDSVGGCGMQQIYNWYESNSYEYEEVKYLLIKLLQDLNYGVGLVLCQVGQDFYNSHLVKALEELNFIPLEYNNYQHGSGYTQRLYQLVIPKK